MLRKGRDKTMRKRLFYWEAIGFGAVCLLGTLGHFLYDWTGENRAVAAFFPVNESTWEHMKLLATPYLLYTLAECCSLARELENFLAAKAAGLLAGLLAIPVLFYSIGGMFGGPPEWVNISIFFVAAAVAFFVSHRVMTHGALRGGWWQAIGFLLLWGSLLLSVWCTFHPPELPLFLDPVTLTYGIGV